MTSRLYYTDAYLAEFAARIVDRRDDGRRVYLDRTAFYPTSGGQPNDVGSIGGVPVDDVVDEGGEVAHVLTAPLPAHETVNCRVDWGRRFDHMQQHTGQHLLSAVFSDQFGYATVSVHFGPETSTLDLDLPSIGRDQAMIAEQRANAIVFENRAVSVSFEDAAEATGLRRPSDRDGTLRIVTIAGLDRSACGGTHVRATGEVGPVLIRKLDRGRGFARVEFVCGTRAVRRARADYEALSAVAAPLSASIDDVAALVANQAALLRATDAEAKRSRRELRGYRAREIYDAVHPGVGGIRWTKVLDPQSMDELRGLAQAYAALPRAVMLGAFGSPPTIVLAASEDSGVDAGRALKDALPAVGGRGGGSPRFAQGSVPSSDAVRVVVEALAPKA